MTRIESPSSINTYLQCPRKYFYSYIAEVPRKKNIYLIRGNIVHSVLEEFYDINIESISQDNFEMELKSIILDLLKQNWIKKKREIFSLGLRKEEIGFYFNESQNMLLQWLEDFIDKLDGADLVGSFKSLIPRREEYFISEKHNVRGFIDAVHEGKEINIVDYKTSSRDYINDEIKLQMGIYALLYKEKHRKKPDKAIVNFLKFGEREIEISDNLLEQAIEECRKIQESTKSKDINDYEMKPNPLCKWKTGQCDFYEYCFEGKSLKK